MDIRIKRAYAPASSHDGTRILVDRLWPRGLKKSDAHVAQWMKEIAPSGELRKWFGHDPARWEEFRSRYKNELGAKCDLLAELRSLAQKEQLTLVYSARDEAHNQAVVLREALLHNDVVASRSARSNKRHNQVWNQIQQQRKP
jgi:uncharacterized protein YeaO (DUF488 family)